MRKKLEVRRFQQKKKPRGNKIPAGTSYSEIPREESEEGVSGMNRNTSFDSEHNDGEDTDVTNEETDNEVPDSPGEVTTSDDEDKPELPDPEAYDPTIKAIPVRKQCESWILKGQGKGKGCGDDSRPLVRGCSV